MHPHHLPNTHSHRYRLGDWSFGSRHIHQFEPFVIKTMTSTPPTTTSIVTLNPHLEEHQENVKEGLKELEDDQFEERSDYKDEEQSMEEQYETNSTDLEEHSKEIMDLSVSTSFSSNSQAIDDEYSISSHNSTREEETAWKVWHPATDQLVKEETTSVGSVIGGVIAVFITNIVILESKTLIGPT